MDGENTKDRGTGFICFAAICAAWLWQLVYAGVAAVVQVLTEPDRCVAGWSWPQPLPWSACRGFGFSDTTLHLLGLPGDIAMYPFSLWPYVMSSGVAANPQFWLLTVIYLMGLWWAMRTLVRRFTAG